MLERLAIRAHLRHVSPSTGKTIELVALRRPEITVRRTDYRGVIVDERVLTRAFPWRSGTGRRVLALLQVGIVGDK